MTTSKKSITIILFAIIITAFASCTRKTGTGCPAWGKVNKMQTDKKSV